MHDITYGTCSQCVEMGCAVINEGTTQPAASGDSGRNGAQASSANEVSASPGSPIPDGGGRPLAGGKGADSRRVPAPSRAPRTERQQAERRASTSQAQLPLMIHTPMYPEFQYNYPDGYVDIMTGNAPGPDGRCSHSPRPSREEMQRRGGIDHYDPPHRRVNLEPCAHPGCVAIIVGQHEALR